MHEVEVMRAHEETENSLLVGMRLMTDPDSQISMASLREGRYEAFGAFDYIRQHGSLEGKFEALNFVKENYIEVDGCLKEMKNQWIQETIKHKDKSIQVNTNQ